MRRRSNRLRENAESLQADEGKVHRRHSDGNVLGLNVPAESKNLEDVQALDSAAAVVAAILDYYNKTQHDKGDDTGVKEGGSETSVHAESFDRLNRPSENPETRLESMVRLIEEGGLDSEAGAAAGTPANNTKVAGAAAAASTDKKKKERKNARKITS